MKRAIFDGTAELRIIEVPQPRPAKGEVVVRVDSATICGTDLHILAGNYTAKPMTCLGHEFAGYIEEVGEGVTIAKKGDLVTVEPHKFCGMCKYCRNGKIQQCLNKVAFGIHDHGGFQQYACLPQQNIYVVPAGISAAEAAMCETVGCCLHGVERVAVTGGDTVVILGGGVIGLLLLKLSRLYGASQVLVSEPDAERRRLLLANGADQVIDPLQEDVFERVMQATANLGADVVIEAAGRAATAAEAFRLVGRAGRILYFGIVPPGQKIEIEPNDIFFRELSIYGSTINPFAHQRVVSLLKRLDVADLVTHTFPLEQINEAMQAAREARGLKICIKPNN